MFDRVLKTPLSLASLTVNFAKRDHPCYKKFSKQQNHMSQDQKTFSKTPFCPAAIME